MVAYAVAGVVALLSINPVANTFSRNQIMNTSFDPLHLVNTYGAFGTVGRERLNVVFEGTHADVPDETAECRSEKNASASSALSIAARLADVVRLDEHSCRISVGISPDLEASPQRRKCTRSFRLESIPEQPCPLYSSCPVSILLRQARERAGRVVEPRKTRTLAAAAFRGRPAPRLAAPSGGLAEPR